MQNAGHGMWHAGRGRCGQQLIRASREECLDLLPQMDRRILSEAMGVLLSDSQLRISNLRQSVQKARPSLSESVCQEPAALAWVDVGCIWAVCSGGGP